MNRHQSKGLRRAFANIEFLIVLAVPAILMAILVPNFIKARAQGQLRACQSNLKNIATALEMYASDSQEQYPASLSELTRSVAGLKGGPYLKLVPSCPTAGVDSYSRSYQVSAAPQRFTLACQGHYHKSLGVAPDYPKYTISEGLLAGPSVPQESSFSEVLLGMVAVSLFLSVWGYFFHRVSQRPELMPQAGAVVQRHPWLGWSSWLCWVLLCFAFAGLVWAASLRFFFPWIAPFAAPVLGSLLAERVVRAGWWLWRALSPSEPVSVVPASPGPNPELGASLRARVLLNGVQRKLRRVWVASVPFLAIVVLATGPSAESAEPLRNSLYGLAAGVLLSFPVYLWAQRWARELFDRELELIPGSGLLLGHGYSCGQPTVRQLGTQADVTEIETVPEGYSLRIRGRRYLINASDFVEALGGTRKR